MIERFFVFYYYFFKIIFLWIMDLNHLHCHLRGAVFLSSKESKKDLLILSIIIE